MPHPLSQLRALIVTAAKGIVLCVVAEPFPADMSCDVKENAAPMLRQQTMPTASAQPTMFYFNTTWDDNVALHFHDDNKGVTGVCTP